MTRPSPRVFSGNSGPDRPPSRIPRPAGFRDAVPTFVDDHVRAIPNPFAPSAPPAVDVLPCNGVLLEYLTSSPEAAELFAVWDRIGASSTHRLITGTLRALGAVVRFGPPAVRVAVARHVCTRLCVCAPACVWRWPVVFAFVDVCVFIRR